MSDDDQNPTTTTTPQEQPPAEDREYILYRMLMVTLYRLEEMSEMGRLNLSEVLTKEVKTFWRTEKATARTAISKKARRAEENRRRRHALGKLTAEEKRLLSVS